MAERKKEQPLQPDDPLLRALHAGEDSRRAFLASLDPRQRAVLAWEGEE
jgi:hypothetical protein